jgi:phage N-6-adenine-methyltransferase
VTGRITVASLERAKREIARLKAKLAKGKTGASLNRGGSKQDKGTPRVFLDACEGRFGKITFDLAATKKNAVVQDYFTRRDNALVQDWPCDKRTLCWLNPEFSDIAPWAEKCAHESVVHGAKILFLVPASVGSEWFFHHVHKKALVLPLRGRIVFVGQKNGFPKDLMLCAYGVGETGFGDPWKWKAQWP